MESFKYCSLSPKKSLVGKWLIKKVIRREVVNTYNPQAPYKAAKPYSLVQ